MSRMLGRASRGTWKPRGGVGITLGRSPSSSSSSKVRGGGMGGVEAATRDGTKGLAGGVGARWGGAGAFGASGPAIEALPAAPVPAPGRVAGAASRSENVASITVPFCVALTSTVPTPSTRVRHCAGVGPSASTYRLPPALNRRLRMSSTESAWLPISSIRPAPVRTAGFRPLRSRISVTSGRARGARSERIAIISPDDLSLASSPRSRLA